MEAVFSLDNVRYIIQEPSGVYKLSDGSYKRKQHLYINCFKFTPHLYNKLGIDSSIRLGKWNERKRVY